MQALLSVILLTVVVVSAFWLGRRLVELMGFANVTSLELLVFSIATGLALHSFVILSLAITGLLSQITILIWLLIAFILSVPFCIRLLREAAPVKTVWGGLSPVERLLLLLLILELALTAMHSFSPAWDYDGLMYHLTAPERFLDSGRILLLPDLWQANGPAAVDMLFTIGLAFDSQMFSKGIELTFAVLLTVSVFSFGLRFFSRPVAWTSAVILAATPIFPVWATWSYTDMAWALFEFLAVYMAVGWIKNQSRHWLIGAGVFTGLALCTKYLALSLPVVLSLAVLFASRGEKAKLIVRRLVVYALLTLIVAAPWYFKNIFLAGNPVFPFLIGGPGWDAERLRWLNEFLRSFNSGGSALAILGTPLSLFLDRGLHVGQSGGIEIPSPLFLTIIFLPLVRRMRTANYLIGIAALRFLFWMAGSQQTRLLLPVFPLLSLLSGYALTYLLTGGQLNRFAKPIRLGLILGMMITTLYYLFIYTSDVGPLHYVFGKETRTEFLARVVPASEAWQFIMDETQAEAKVFFLWDGRGYYCDQRCEVDAEQSRWTQQVFTHEDLEGLIQSMTDMGITHFYLSKEDLNFMLMHDPEGMHRLAAEVFLHDFVPTCTIKLFENEDAAVYKYICS